MKYSKNLHPLIKVHFLGLTKKKLEKRLTKNHNRLPSSQQPLFHAAHAHTTLLLPHARAVQFKNSLNSSFVNGGEPCIIHLQFTLASFFS